MSCWKQHHTYSPPLQQSYWMLHPFRSGPIVSSSAAILPPFLICSYAKPQLVRSWININQSCVKHMSRKNKQSTHWRSLAYNMCISYITLQDSRILCLLHGNMFFNMFFLRDGESSMNPWEFYSILQYPQDANWQNNSSNLTQFAGIQLAWVITMATLISQTFPVMLNNFTVSRGNA